MLSPCMTPVWTPVSACLLASVRFRRAGVSHTRAVSVSCVALRVFIPPRQAKQYHLSSSNHRNLIRGHAAVAPEQHCRHL